MGGSTYFQQLTAIFEGGSKVMIRLWKVSAISLLALATLVPLASAKHKSVIYYQTSSGTGWYQVYTQPQSTSPAYTYEVPSSTERVYVYPAPTLAAGTGRVKIKVPSHDTAIFVDGQFAGTTDHVAKLGLEAGTHNIQMRDRAGNIVFNENVAVSANQETELKPHK
jgi:hypothetical protein